MAARPIWRGQIRLALVSIPVELYSATKSGAAIQFHQVHEPTGKRIKYEKVVPGVGPVNTRRDRQGLRSLEGPLRSSRAGRDRGGEARKPQDARPRPVRRHGRDRRHVFRPALFHRARRRPRRRGVRGSPRCLAGGEEGRRRTTGDARPGICRRDQAVRPRHASGDAALCRRGQQGAVLFPRDRRRKAGRRSARHGLDADRAEGRQVRPVRVPQPLRRRAARADQGEAARQGREDHPGPGRRRAAAQGLQRRRPDGGAEAKPRQ